MGDKMIVAGVLMDEHVTLSFLEVCEQCHISEHALYDMMEHGLFSPLEASMVDSRELKRIASVHRLQQDLGLNMAGAVLVLELMDELTALRDEVAMLRRHVGS